MDVVLELTYLEHATHGKFFIEGMVLCRSIELPWRNNVRQKSCIPEGRYRLVKRFSGRFHWHFEVRDVPGRSAILIHPANDAVKELQGCIAPVTHFLTEGIVDILAKLTTLFLIKLTTKNDVKKRCLEMG